MQHASGLISKPQACQSPVTTEAIPEHTISCKEALTANDEGGARPSDEENIALARDGLLGKLQRTLSFSLSRISSIVPAPNASRRRKSSVGVDANAPVAEAGEEGTDADASSPALDALLPFVPLMFRRDLLLPEPSFSTMQVARPHPPSLEGHHIPQSVAASVQRSRHALPELLKRLYDEASCARNNH